MYLAFFSLFPAAPELKEMTRGFRWLVTGLFPFDMLGSVLSSYCLLAIWSDRADRSALGDGCFLLNLLRQGPSFGGWMSYSGFG